MPTQSRHRHPAVSRGTSRSEAAAGQRACAPLRFKGPGPRGTASIPLSIHLPPPRPQLTVPCSASLVLGWQPFSSLPLDVCNAHVIAELACAHPEESAPSRAEGRGHVCGVGEGRGFPKACTLRPPGRACPGSPALAPGLKLRACRGCHASGCHGWAVPRPSNCALAGHSHLRKPDEPEPPTRWRRRQVGHRGPCPAVFF